MNARLMLFLAGIALATLTTTAASPAPIENPLFRLVLSPAAQPIELIERSTGRNLLRPGASHPFATAQRGGTEHPANSAAIDAGRLRLRFGDSGIEAALRIESRPSCVVLTVESVSGDPDTLRFIDLSLALEGRPQEPVGACTLSLNLSTRIDDLPALQRELRASAEKKFGLIGARAALVVAPMDRMLASLRETLSGASELPVCTVAGPWAHDVPFNHGSYLFNFGTLTETNVADWIEMTRRVGFTQIDNHGGSAFFRFGDFELDRKKWPDGWNGYSRIVRTLHDAGIGSIFHTYAFFIDKGSKYVTPVPDPRLDAFRVFTLAEPLTVDATEFVVNESTAGLSTLTGFFEQNSVVLHLDDELVTFGGFSKTPPWRFTGVRRGAHATRAASHPQGTRARHLKEMFGLFVPDVGSTLFTEIAANHADVVNQCGFDGLYLDAIDGSSILRGPDECWHWAAVFVAEIQKRLRHPAGMEMSAMWHHLWQYRTRWQAWDVPRRGHARFIDLHAQSVNGGLMLPLHLGWWELWAFDPPQVEPTYPDVIEQLGARLIGWDAGISLTAGMNKEVLRKTPLFSRAAEILRTCEELRHARQFDDATRARLRDPAQTFALLKTADGRTRFRSIQPIPATITLNEPWSRHWSVTNGFAPHPARLRIETLMSAAPISPSNTVVLADLSTDANTTWTNQAAVGITGSLQRSASSPDLTYLLATNAGATPRSGAWVRFTRGFDPLLSAKDAKAITLDVEGDGSGAILAIRLESPAHIGYGAVADRYVTLDFTGRRRLVLVETESGRWSDYEWGDGRSAYGVYRELVDFGKISSISIGLNGLPPGRPCRVGISRVMAIPFKPARLPNPRLVVNGQSVVFPVELEPGAWIEGDSPAQCIHYGPRGEPRGRIVPDGPWPMVRPGVNTVEFGSADSSAPNSRARVTMFLQGEPL